MRLTPFYPSDEYGGNIHLGAVSFHHDNSGLGHVVVLPILLRIVADGGIRRHANVLVENRPPDLRATPDVAVVENHAVFH